MAALRKATPGFSQTHCRPFAQTLENTESEQSLPFYFESQSQGIFDLHVTVYDKVIVTAKDEIDYGPGNLNIAMLTEEILDSLDADPAFDFGDHDLNDDGWIDHIFIVPRQLGSTHLVSASAGGFSELKLHSR